MTLIEPSSLILEARRCSSIALCSSVSDFDSLMFHESSMRDEVLLTCCPPAPDDLDAFASISDRGIDNWSLTSMESPIGLESTDTSWRALAV